MMKDKKIRNEFLKVIIYSIPYLLLTLSGNIEFFKDNVDIYSRLNGMIFLGLIWVFIISMTLYNKVIKLNKYGYSRKDLYKYLFKIIVSSLLVTRIIEIMIVSLSFMLQKGYSQHTYLEILEMLIKAELILMIITLFMVLVTKTFINQFIKKNNMAYVVGVYEMFIVYMVSIFFSGSIIEKTNGTIWIYGVLLAVITLLGFLYYQLTPRKYKEIMKNDSIK